MWWFFFFFVVIGVELFMTLRPQLRVSRISANRLRFLQHTMSKQVKTLSEMTGRMQQDLQVEVRQWRQRDNELIARVAYVEDLIVPKAIDVHQNDACKLHPQLNLRQSELEGHVSRCADLSKKQMLQPN